MTDQRDRKDVESISSAGSSMDMYQSLSMERPEHSAAGMLA